MPPLHHTPLSKNWFFRQTTTLNSSCASTYLPVSQFPTVAHLDLLHHKLIPDPYIDTNELDCLWVNDADFTYRTTFPSPSLSSTLSEDENKSTTSTRTHLVFSGLDTIVSVFLNGQKILEGRNMHISYRVDVTDHLKQEGEGENELELRFSNAPAFAKSEMKRIGYKGNGTDVHFGGPERLFVRKAQYHWGWDWGPALNTSGPWKEIHLETFTERISQFLVRQTVSPDLSLATIIISGKTEGAQPSSTITLTILSPTGTQILTQETSLSPTGTFTASLQISNPELWYPFTYGSQPLYTVTASLGTSDSQSRTLGLRRLQLLQHPLKSAPGTSFLFALNNTPIFCGGSCWIPGDYLLPRMTPSRYTSWLQLAKAGNQVMIRVWGGGIVESDDFYRICDEEGILVWQDFLFACGDYPASGGFVEEVKKEAEEQVERVGHHACLAIWAGNNEDYMLAERWGWEYDIEDQEGPWDNTNFPARKIYERVLPEVCERLAGDVPYWRSSPYGGKTSNDVAVGDTHIWDVWHGPMAPYQDYKAYTSRFVSEFGFESAPSIRTLHKAITNPRERHWQSQTFDAHDKGPNHQRRYGMYSGENFRFRFNPLRDFIYSTQYLQAEAMKYAYNHWRRAFRGPGDEICSGILVWQLNDIWPATSWALIDSSLSLKPSYFITKRALARISLGIERLTTSEPPYMVTSYLPKKSRAAVWAVNGGLERVEALLYLSAWDIESGVEVDLGLGLDVPAEERERKVVLEANQSTELIEALDIPHADTTVLYARLVSLEGGEVLARWVDWPEPLKFIHFAKSPTISISPSPSSPSSSSSSTITLTSTHPLKGVVLSIPPNSSSGGEDDEDAVWDDNFIDLIPGEEVRVGVKGLGGRKVEARWLCDWEGEEGFEL
ncbi:glycoside hydrolase family 2 protein [Leptodontidium sp. MPI-SDFR-AT-0119]|nr:glycoside hydrolase family 2 protein [Leptodontidium sp. MPI-SDFR-AT-0119]